MTKPPLGGQTPLATASNIRLQRPLEWLPRALAWGGHHSLLILVAIMTLVAGCAAPQRNEAFAPVQELVRDQLGVDLYWATNDGDRAIIDQRVRELLSKPLAMDDAVQVALLNHRGLQAAFQGLGIAQADLVSAGRLPNPGLVIGRKTQGSEIEIERLFVFNLARLIVLPRLAELESRRFAQTQTAVIQEVLRHAAETRKAYLDAVAAVETQRYTRQVMQAADAGADLARRMEQAGNFNKLQRAREQGFYADAALNLARAEQVQRTTRERLTRLLGVWGEPSQFTLPDRLPDLPLSPRELPEVEQLAVSQRLDVLNAKRAAEQTAQSLGLTRMTRFINVLELGVTQNSFSDGPAQRGYEISVELPLFDWGDSRVAKAEAIYRQALDRAAQAAVAARSEAREAYGNYRSAYDIARFQRDEVLPVQRRIAEENLLRYNGMLIGVFELLADARSQINSVNQTIEATRNFWIAQSDLDLALIGKPGLLIPTGLVPITGSAGATH